MSLGDYRWEIHTNTNRIWNLYIATHGGQWGKLDSIVFSLLTEAEEIQSSHSSASFMPSLHGPACPCPTPPLTRDPVSSPKHSPHTEAPHKWQGLLHPSSPQPLLQFSVLSSLSHHFVLWCRQFPVGEKARIRASHHTHVSLEWYCSKAMLSPLLELF